LSFESFNELHHLTANGNIYVVSVALASSHLERKPSHQGVGDSKGLKNLNNVVGRRNQIANSRFMGQG
jgi:hypothetical protein